jgi:hypothetical protein
MFFMIIRLVSQCLGQLAIFRDVRRVGRDADGQVALGLVTGSLVLRAVPPPTSPVTHNFIPPLHYQESADPG